MIDANDFLFFQIKSYSEELRSYTSTYEFGGRGGGHNSVRNTVKPAEKISVGGVFTSWKLWLKNDVSGEFHQAN